jgi:hypothetical protein
MPNNKPRNVDITKATLFTLLILFVSFGLIYFAFIPDMRRLKIVTMAKDRANITLQQVKSELKLQQSNLIGLKQNYKEELAALDNEFAIETFHKDAANFFSKFDFRALQINPAASLNLPRMIVSEYNVSAELREPDDFYDFVEFINSYKNAIEITLPITIKVDQSDRLLWNFGIKIYQSSSDQSER